MQNKGQFRKPRELSAGESGAQELPDDAKVDHRSQNLRLPDASWFSVE